MARQQPVAKAKRILEACRMSFEGKSNEEISNIFNVTPSTVSRWRQHSLWLEFESELIANHKKAVVSEQQVAAS